MTKRWVSVALAALLCAAFAVEMAASCPGSAPVLLSPGNNAQESFGFITLDWDSVANATGYEVYAGLDGDPPSLLGSTAGTQKVIEVEAGRTVQWKVGATAPSCSTQYSSYFFFTTSCPTGAPQITGPANGSQFDTGKPITFSWAGMAGATGYDVQVTPDHGATFQTIASDITTTAFTTTALPAGDWGWTVRANYDGGCGPFYAEPSALRVGTSERTCPSNPGKATLLSPAANAATLASPVTFSWTAVSGAAGYRLAGAVNGTEAETLALTTSTQATVSLPTGNGFWFVQAFFGDGCATTVSDRRIFTITQGSACPTTPPQLVSPANNSVPTTRLVTFQWNGITNATGYELWVATGGKSDFVLYGVTDPKTTQLEKFVPDDIVDWYVVARLSGCANLRSSTFRFGTARSCNLSPVTLTGPANGAEVSSPVTLGWNAVAGATEYRLTIRAGDSSTVSRVSGTTTTVRLPAGAFSWRVEALAGECRSESPERTFTVRTAANCDSNVAPTLVSPNGTAAQPTRVTSPVTLTWNAVPNALAYQVWLSRNGAPFEDVAVTSATSKELAIDDYGPMAWFVNAIFEGCAAKRSSIGYFDIAKPACRTGAPSIIAPTAGQTVPGNVTFQWSEVPGALKYRVIAIVAGEPKLLGTTDDTQFERVLQPGTYTYTIEAVFEECRSTFAPATTFSVGRSQSCGTDVPSNVFPANGATVSNPEVTFIWSPVSGAIRYAVAARVDDGTETLLETTEDTNLTHLMPPGKISWRVIAFFPGCDSRSSARTMFNVPPPQSSCSDRKPVLLFPNGERVVQSPVQFSWLGVPKADEYRLWIQRSDERPSVAATTKVAFASVALSAGTYRWFVEARFPNCPPVFSAVGEFTAGTTASCGTPRKPDAQVVGRALSGTSYNLRWMPLPQTSQYEVQESATGDFANAQTFVSQSPFRTFSHTTTGAPIEYFYRVRGLAACNDAPGPYSDIVSVYIVDAKTNSSTAELGSSGELVVQRVFVPGGTTPVAFTTKTDKPWLLVTPTSGTVPPEGITLTVTTDPSVLGLGTNTGTVQLAYTSSVRGGGIATNDGPPPQTSFPMSISLVTPVMPDGKGTPPPDALIFPAVGHAAGVNDSLFESDVRLTNLTTRTMKYDLYFTPSGVDGTENSASTTIEVSPSESIALDDVVANMFGDGTVGSAIGMLEVRPVTTSQDAGDFFGGVTTSAIRQLETAASSRTYNFTPNGTFGQFIPAIPFAQFVGRGAILSLQQVAQSSQFRANFGFLEASGNPATLLVRVYDTANTLLTSFPLSLRAMEHRQINGLLAANGITNLADGRVEVEVTDGDGRVSAYVSEVDNVTNDPLMVSPVIKGATRANRYVVPGMASLRSGSALWVSDLRIFNGGTTATPATLTFYPMGNPGGAISREVTLDAGEIEVLDNVLVNTFGLSDGGGSVVITTPAETSLTATARTYNQTTNGTYGQFIPGVTVAESIGIEDRALQVLQVEQSTRFRTNIGINETSGKPVTVEVGLITPDSFTTTFVTIGLAANEFRQIGLVDFNPSGAVYNGRVTVKVIGGEGKVTAYGSAIDSITQDPTYVPAQ